MGIGRGNSKAIIDSTNQGTIWGLEFHELLQCDSEGDFWDLHDAAVTSQTAFDTEAASQFSTRYSGRTTEFKTAARESFKRLVDPSKKRP